MSHAILNDNCDNRNAGLRTCHGVGNFTAAQLFTTKMVVAAKRNSLFLVTLQIWMACALRNSPNGPGKAWPAQVQERSSSVAAEGCGRGLSETDMVRGVGGTKLVRLARLWGKLIVGSV